MRVGIGRVASDVTEANVPSINRREVVPFAISRFSRKLARKGLLPPRWNTAYSTRSITFRLGRIPILYFSPKIWTDHKYVVLPAKFIKNILAMLKEIKGPPRKASWDILCLRPTVLKWSLRHICRAEVVSGDILYMQGTDKDKMLKTVL